MNQIKILFERDEVKSKFREILGNKSASFVTSLLQIISQSDGLKKADPTSVYQAAAVAATLDLPLNENLGFAYIIPYNDKHKGVVAQFQLGYKGFIQLAQRSGLFKSIYASSIMEGQIIEANPLDGYKFDFNVKSDKVVGYAAKFTLTNGFEAVYYMSIEQLQKHGIMYSKQFKKGVGLWKDNFDTMATKTVLKLLLSKYAPLSVEMQKAVVADQSVIKDFESIDVIYVDNNDDIVPEQPNKEKERFKILIEDANSIDDLQKLAKHLTLGNNDWADLQEMYQSKFDMLKQQKNVK
jgi:recombination protein RecT